MFANGASYFDDFPKNVNFSYMIKKHMLRNHSDAAKVRRAVHEYVKSDNKDEVIVKMSRESARLTKYFCKYTDIFRVFVSYTWEG